MDQNTSTQPAGLYAPEVADRPKYVSDARRIALRLFGGVMIAVGVAFWAALIALGTGGFVEAFGGERCSSDVAALAPGADGCESIWDLAGYGAGALVLIVAGLCLVLMLRKPASA